MNILVERAKKVVDDYFKGKIPNLSYGIALTCSDLTNEQIKRVIVLCNLITFYRFFDKLKEKTFSFELASFPKVLQYLKENAAVVKMERQKMIKERVKEEEEKAIYELLYQEPNPDEIEQFFANLLKVKEGEEKEKRYPLFEALLGKEKLVRKDFEILHAKLANFSSYLTQYKRYIPIRISQLYDVFYNRLREHLANFPLKMIYTASRQFFPEPISKRDIDICGAFFETAVEELKARGILRDDETFLVCDTNMLRGVSVNSEDKLFRAIAEAKDLIARYYMIKNLLPNIDRLKNEVVLILKGWSNNEKES